ncbi:MAG: protein kinase [Actinomycetota bacterium]|nr:protein kinase [Actinomycetota bacterium]
MQGLVIKNRYRIDSIIGRGGTAMVYNAFDLDLHRRVAVKILHRHLMHNSHFVERFKREARAAANLVHPNIVSIYDTGYSAGTYFIVMEHARGKTLKQIISERAPIPVNEAVDIVRQIANALGHAHSKGVIHRDIKPQNILVNEEGIVKVTDFGIARALDLPSMTLTGKVLGTARYISPEQAKGQPADRRSDIYSLGIIFYELLTGYAPFEGDSSIDLMEKHIAKSPARPRSLNPNIPPALEIVIDKLLKKDPNARFQDIESLIDTLSLWDSLEKQDLLLSSLPSRTELRHRRMAKASKSTTDKSNPKRQAKEGKVGFKKAVEQRYASFILKMAIRAVVRAAACAGIVIAILASYPLHLDEWDVKTFLQKYGGRVAGLGIFAGEQVGLLSPVEAIDYDPDGNGDESPDLVGYAIDGDKNTAWSTESYKSSIFGGLKSGVGIYINYGKPVYVMRMFISSSGGWEGAIKGSNDVLNWKTIKNIKNAAKEMSLEINEGRYKYYLIWLSRLPDTESGIHRCRIYEVKAYGAVY